MKIKKIITFLGFILLIMASILMTSKQFKINEISYLNHKNEQLSNKIKKQTINLEKINESAKKSEDLIKLEKNNLEELKSNTKNLDKNENLSSNDELFESDDPIYFMFKLAGSFTPMILILFLIINIRRFIG